MQFHTRTELLSVLIQEALQNLTRLDNALDTQETQRDEGRGARLQQEREWWGNAHRGLTAAHSACLLIQHAERGVLTRSAGA